MSIAALIAGPGTLLGPIGAGVAAAAALYGLIAQAFQGCGQTCIQATAIANQVEQYLKQNVAQYLAYPTRTVSMQQAFLLNFDSAWQQLTQACGNPALGAAGQRCISERQRGGVALWCPNPGHTGCDWFALYRDPIANDPGVVADPSPLSNVGAAVSSIFTGTASSFPWWLLAIPVGGILLLSAIDD